MEIKGTYQQIKQIIPKILKAKRTPAIWGPPGIGKSSLGREIAKELGCEIVVLDAPLLQPFDYAIAVPDHSEKKVKLYDCGYLPQKGPVVVLVEDLPHAKSYQMIPLMQIILDRRIGNLKFADDVYFIITGNREEDLADVNFIPSPLLNRIIHLNLEVNFEEWEKWAKSSGINEKVIAFLKSSPQYFLELPSEGQKAFATPRSWHAFSDILNVGVENEEELRIIAYGCIGPKAGSSFMGWWKYFQSLNPKEIIEKGEVNYKNNVELYSVILSVTSYLKKNVGEIEKNKENLGKIFNSLPGEFKMFFLKELVEYKENGINIKIIEKFVQNVPDSVKFFKSLQI